jgi:hypothetical protein
MSALPEHWTWWMYIIGFIAISAFVSIASLMWKIPDWFEAQTELAKQKTLYYKALTSAEEAKALRGYRD